MRKLAIIESEITAELGKFILSVQTFQRPDEVAASKIVELSGELTRSLKGEALIPRVILHQVRMGSKALRAEAEYAANKSLLIDLADKLELTLDLILSGKSVDDLTPGVPRIL